MKERLTAERPIAHHNHHFHQISIRAKKKGAKSSAQLAVIFASSSDLSSQHCHPTTIIIPSSSAMEDLLSSFADQSMESASEEGYKYHFIDGSPAGSEHAMPVSHAATAPAGSSHDDPFPANEASSNQKGISSGVEDEANYNADIDDDDDDDDDDAGVYGREEATQEVRYVHHNEDPINGASHNENSVSEYNTDARDRSFHSKVYNAFETYGVKSGATNRNVEQPSASSGGGQDGLNGFAQHLRRLHRHDVERDEFLSVRVLPSASMFAPRPCNLLTLLYSNFIRKIST